MVTVGLQLRRECSLAELMDHETCMVKQIRSLDSDMQTLVYENYNKFISATGEKTSESQSSFVLEVGDNIFLLDAIFILYLTLSVHTFP